MTANDYQKISHSTLNKAISGQDIMLNAALGIAGEAGEIADYIKKSLYQGHYFSKNHLVDEMGDLLWYVALMATYLGVTLEDVFEYNVEKLSLRYPKGFTEENSINRGV